MTHRGFDEHLSAERLQAFLEGSLASGEHAQTGTHIAQCARCSAELDGWRVLFEDLTDLPSMRPLEGFVDRVMSEVLIPEQLPLVARVRARLRSLLPASGTDHVGPDRIQDLLDGILPGLQVARVKRHLAACAPCQAELQGWSAVLRQLDALERLAPGGHFAEAVMAGLHAPIAVRVPAASAYPSRALAWVRTFVPQTRRAWAALSGIAVTPAVTFALVAYAVFSHPTLTPGALASFAWWQLADLAALGWTAVSGVALESTQVFGLGALWQTATAAPVVLGAGVLLYTVFSALALRVLYRNLITTRPVDTRYAQLSAS